MQQPNRRLIMRANACHGQRPGDVHAIREIQRAGVTIGHRGFPSAPLGLIPSEILQQHGTPGSRVAAVYRLICNWRMARRAREFQRDVDSDIVLHDCPPSQMPEADSQTLRPVVSKELPLAEAASDFREYAC